MNCEKQGLLTLMTRAHVCNQHSGDKQEKKKSLGEIIKGEQFSLQCEQRRSYWGRMKKRDTGKRKTASFTWNGLVWDVKAASSLWIEDFFNFFYVFIFFAWLTRYPTSYCVMSPLGSTGSSHFRKIISSSGVKVRDSGAMPPGTATGEKNNLCWNKHSAWDLTLMDSCTSFTTGVKTALTERERTGPGSDGTGLETGQKRGDERKLCPGLLSALRMNWEFWLRLSDNRAPCLGGWQSIFLLYHLTHLTEIGRYFHQRTAPVQSSQCTFLCFNEMHFLKDKHLLFFGYQKCCTLYEVLIIHSALVLCGNTWWSQSSNMYQTHPFFSKFYLSLLLLLL